MKKQIIGMNTLRTSGGRAYSWPDEPRPAAWFVGAIRKAMKKDIEEDVCGLAVEKSP